jgi:hypothetical protein
MLPKLAQLPASAPSLKPKSIKMTLSEKMNNYNSNSRNMNQETEFPFDRARRVTPQENQKFRAAIVSHFGLESRKYVAHSKEEEHKSQL